jgi:hypothetical protein
MVSVILYSSSVFCMHSTTVKITKVPMFLRNLLPCLQGRSKDYSMIFEVPTAVTLIMIWDFTSFVHGGRRKDWYV